MVGGPGAEAIAHGGDDHQAKGPLGPGLGPEDRGEGLDAEGVELASGVGRYLLPGGRLVLAQGLGGGGGRAVEAFGASGLLVGRGGKVEEFGVLADSSDQDGPVGQAFENRPVAVASVDVGDQEAIVAVEFLVESLAGLDEGGDAGGGEILCAALLSVGLPLLRRGVALGLGHGRDVVKADGQGAGGAGEGLAAGQGGHLKEPLGADEVGVERGAQRVAAIAHAGDLRAGFGQVGVVHGHHQRPPGPRQGQHAAEDRIEQSLVLPAVLGEEAVVGGPVHVESAGGGEPGGAGVPAQAGQLADGQPAAAVPGAALSEDVHVLLPESQEVVEEAQRFFLPAAASGRRRSRCCLSWTVHSTVSPLVNSMAWARAAGKLMYHCWLS